jgi:hypothetical protein
VLRRSVFPLSPLPFALTRFLLSVRLRLLVVAFAGAAIAIGCNYNGGYPDKIRNDTGRPVVLKQCGADLFDWLLRRGECDVIQGTYELSPNQEVTVAYASTDEDVTEFFIVEDAAGRRMGCLKVRIHGQQPNPVNVSDVQNCPG